MTTKTATGSNRRALTVGALFGFMIVAALAVALSMMITHPAHSQTTDPYAKSLIGPLKEQYQDVIYEAYAVISGWKCGVIHPNRSWLELQMQENYILQNLVNAGIGAEAQKLHKTFTTAIDDAQKDGCDYWKQHPEDVLAMRQGWNY